MEQIPLLHAALFLVSGLLLLLLLDNLQEFYYLRRR
jgi:hypothetical protein